MTKQALNAILHALRSGRYYPETDDLEAVVPYHVPSHRTTCLGGVIFDTYRRHAVVAEDHSRFFPGFAKWMGMNDVQLDVFAEWTGHLFKRTRDFNVCADVIERFFDNRPKIIKELDQAFGSKEDQSREQLMAAIVRQFKNATISLNEDGTLTVDTHEDVEPSEDTKGPAGDLDYDWANLEPVEKETSEQSGDDYDFARF